MKKTYIIPQTLVTEIQLQQMIAVSGGKKLMDPGTDGNADVSGEVLSRRRSVWDED